MITSRLVLVGGGHSHIQVLKSHLMRPMPNVEIFLVSDQTRSPYSGMLPGHLAGWYRDEEMHFDLVKMCNKAGITFIHGRVNGIDLKQKNLQIVDRPALGFDFVSLNVGIQPELLEGFADQPNVMPLKPISKLLEKWRGWEDSFSNAKVAVVGGGAAGFEVAVALRVRNPSMEIAIIDGNESVLASHSLPVQIFANRRLQELKIGFKQARASGFANGILRFEKGDEKFDAVVLATKAAPPEWFRSSGLAESYLEVNEFLQSPKYDFLFGAGDCVRFLPRNLPKSGVFAVREGPVLSENLRRVLERRSLKKFRPQKRTLALLNSGEKRAILSYGIIAAEGKTLWRWKDRIDRKFMERYNPDLWVGNIRSK